MRIITIANQKGGVGKSTVSCHLALDLAERGHRVLLIDLDTQGNTSKTLAAYDSGSVASALFTAEDACELARLDGKRLAVAAADSELLNLDRADFKVIGVFKRRLAAIDSDFDFCVIDTPPNMGLRLTAALVVADYALSPIELEQYSIDGIHRMLQTIFGVKSKANPELVFAGMLPNRFDPRSDRQKETLRSLGERYSDLVLPAAIGIRKSIPEALAAGIPVWELKTTSGRDAARQYKAAFAAVYEKLGGVA